MSLTCHCPAAASPVFNKPFLWSSCFCQLLFQCQRAGTAPGGRGAHRYFQLHLFQQLGGLRES